VKFWEFWTHLWGISSKHLWEPCIRPNSGPQRDVLCFPCDPKFNTEVSLAKSLCWVASHKT